MPSRTTTCLQSGPQRRLSGYLGKQIHGPSANLNFEVVMVYQSSCSLKPYAHTLAVHNPSLNFNLARHIMCELEVASGLARA